MITDIASCFKLGMNAEIQEQCNFEKMAKVQSILFLEGQNIIAFITIIQAVQWETRIFGRLKHTLQIQLITEKIHAYVPSILSG